MPPPPPFPAASVRAFAPRPRPLDHPFGQTARPFRTFLRSSGAGPGGASPAMPCPGRPLFRPRPLPGLNGPGRPVGSPAPHPACPARSGRRPMGPAPPGGPVQGPSPGRGPLRPRPPLPACCPPSRSGLAHAPRGPFRAARNPSGRLRAGGPPGAQALPGPSSRFGSPGPGGGFLYPVLAPGTSSRATRNGGAGASAAGQAARMRESSQERGAGADARGGSDRARYDCAAGGTSVMPTVTSRGSVGGHRRGGAGVARRAAGPFGGAVRAPAHRGREQEWRQKSAASGKKWSRRTWSGGCSSSGSGSLALSCASSLLSSAGQIAPAEENQRASCPRTARGLG